MQIIDVGQVTAYIRDLLDSDPILSDLWLRGEVTSFFESAAGHCYFTLSGDGAQIKAALFKGQRWAVKELPRQGDEVIAHGNVSIYPDQGQYQLYVDFLAPEGTGILQLQFEELQRRLESEGLFDLSRKRQVPELPSTIGVVTSAQGAVWHDIQTVLARRFPIVRVILSPTQVQGADAPQQIRRALLRLTEGASCDVIIVARGGGSPEDLAVFNDEELARAIFRSPVPVVSAIGHETDTTIADLVSDLRAPTPSAAAELIVPDRREIVVAIAARIGEARSTMDERVESATALFSQKVAQLPRHSPERQVERYRRSVDLLRLRGATAIRRKLERQRSCQTSRVARLGPLNPIAVLDRGYAIVEDANAGQRLPSAASLGELPTDVNVRMRDGTVAATVKSRTN